MKCYKSQHENNSILQIYLPKDELQEQSVLEQIEQFKKEKFNVAMFVSGTVNTVKTIQEILNYEKSKNIV